MKEVAGILRQYASYFDILEGYADGPEYRALLESLSRWFARTGGHHRSQHEAVPVGGAGEGGRVMPSAAETTLVRVSTDLAHAIWVLRMDIRERFASRTTMAAVVTRRLGAGPVRAMDVRMLRSAVAAIRILRGDK